MGQDSIPDGLGQLLLVLGGRKPQGAPQGEGDAHRRALFDANPTGNDKAERLRAFRQLQAGGNAPPPPAADPGMIQRALGSLFGTK